MKARWVDRPSGGTEVDDRIGSLLREVRESGAPAAAVVERVGARLRAAPSPAVKSATPRRAVRWAVACLVLLGTASAVFARHRIASLLFGPAPVSSVRPRSAPPTRAPVVVTQAAAVAPVAVSPAAVKAPAAAVAPAAVRAPAGGSAPARFHPSPARPLAASRARPALALRAPVAPAAAPPLEIEPLPPIDPSRPSRAEDPSAGVPSDEPGGSARSPQPPVAPTSAVTPGPDNLGAEALLLQRAIERLRRDRNPGAALGVLEEHRHRFPQGALRRDAEVLRIDALLALGRQDEARALLERRQLDDDPRADDLRLARAELRGAHDCPAALSDFDRLLARRLPAPTLERALRGRAICRLRLEDPRASQDLRRYLDLFPEAPFAADARVRLRDMR